MVKKLVEAGALLELKDMVCSLTRTLKFAQCFVTGKTNTRKAIDFTLSFKFILRITLLRLQEGMSAFLGQNVLK